MPTSFLDLPAELRQPILKHISGDWKASMQLSATCKALRTLLTPTVFRAIRLRNDVRSGMAVRHLAEGPLAHYVEELHFQGFLRLDLTEDCHYFKRYTVSETRSTSQVKRATIFAGDSLNSKHSFKEKELFPPVVEATLSDLHVFPKLALVSVEFFFLLKVTNGYVRWYPEYEYRLQYFWPRGRANVKMMQKDESKRASRLLITKTWDAVVKNTCRVKQLEIYGSHILEMSTRWNPSCWKFQNGITHLTLTERDTHKIVPDLYELNIPRRQAPLPAVSELDRAMSRVEDWSVVLEESRLIFRNKNNMLGQTLHHHWGMSSLQHLCMREIALEGGAYHTILKGRIRQLVTLSLHNVLTICSTIVGAHRAVSWCGFFRDIVFARPTGLRSLQISWTNQYPGSAPDDPTWLLTHIIAPAKLRLPTGSELDLQEVEFDCGCIRWRPGPELARTTEGADLSHVLKIIEANLQAARDLASDDSESLPDPLLFQQFDPNCRLRLQDHSLLHKTWSPYRSWRYGDPEYMFCFRCSAVDPYPFGRPGCTFRAGVF